MADENASLNPKKETVRITLPPRMNEPAPVKRETVRIAQGAASDKGQTIRIQPQSIPPEAQPKKETTKIVSAPVPPPAKPKSAPIPIIPPPPKAAGMPGLPPKPPGAFSVPSAKPTLGQAEAPAAPAPMAPPAALKPSVPKKETSRIPIPAPAPAPRAPMPKATVKLQQTQPLPQAPVASVVKTTSLSLAQAPTVVNEADPVVLYASIAVFAASIAAAVLGYLAFSSCA